MTTCKHAIPGRARFVLPELRTSTTLAQALTAHMGQIEGVRRVDIRPRSASVVVHFDPKALTISDIRHLMNAGDHAAPVLSPLGRAVRRWGTVIAGTALNVLVGGAVKSGIGALVARVRT